MEDRFTFKHRGLTFIGELAASDIPYDELNMGEWTDELQEWAFDSKTGRLLGEHQRVTMHDKTMVALGVKMDEWLKRHTEVEIISLEQMTDYDGDVTGYEIEMQGYQILADDLPVEYDGRNSKRYYVEGVGNLPPSSQWDGCKPEDKLAAIEKYGSLSAACIAYACEDYRRCIAFVRGDWSYMFVSVWLSVNGEKFGPPSVGSGIESDADEAYVMQIAKEEAEEVISEADVDKLTADAAKVAKVLKRLQSN